MSDIVITINGAPVSVSEGAVVATALAVANIAAPLRSVTGQPRGPLCGMGLCGECRVTIDGVPHMHSCQTICQHGMEVTTDASA